MNKNKLEKLAKIYEAWRKRHNFEEGCASELYLNLLDDPTENKFKLAWLNKFIHMWDRAEGN